MEMSSLIWMQGNVDIRCVNYAQARISLHDAFGAAVMSSAANQSIFPADVSIRLAESVIGRAFARTVRSQRRGSSGFCFGARRDLPDGRVAELAVHPLLQK
jgi:hypothetical protein